MNDNKPYLLRAMCEWIEDNHCTPYLYIDTSNHDLLTVPEDLLKSNPLVFSISEQSCRQLTINNDVISFEARFSGVVHHIVIAIDCVLGIIAKENGQGMNFEVLQEGEKAPEIVQAQSKESKNAAVEKSVSKKIPNKSSKLQLIK